MRRSGSSNSGLNGVGPRGWAPNGMCAFGARELQTCTFEGPGFKNTTKIPREDPEERKLAGEGKKRAKFWAVRGGGREGAAERSRGGGSGEHAHANPRTFAAMRENLVA